MTDCNATLTTAAVTDEVVADQSTQLQRDLNAHWWLSIPDGTAVVRRGDRLLRLDVTVLTCGEGSHWGRQHAWHSTDTDEYDDHSVEWTDSTPGATPHADPDPCPTVDLDELERMTADEMHAIQEQINRQVWRMEAVRRGAWPVEVPAEPSLPTDGDTDG